MKEMSQSSTVLAHILCAKSLGNRFKIRKKNDLGFLEFLFELQILKSFDRDSFDLSKLSF